MYSYYVHVYGQDDRQELQSVPVIHSAQVQAVLHISSQMFLAWNHCDTGSYFDLCDVTQTDNTRAPEQIHSGGNVKLSVSC